MRPLARLEKSSGLSLRWAVPVLLCILISLLTAAATLCFCFQCVLGENKQGLGVVRSGSACQEHYSLVSDSPSCLDCDILDIALPADSDKDWNLQGECPLSPHIGGNSAQIVQTLLVHERCYDKTTCNTWVALVGDSLLRAPFNHLIDVLMGPEWPVGFDRNTYNLNTSHVDHRVCCTVHTGPGTLRCTFSREFDTPEFVRRYVRDLINSPDSPGQPTQSICITWQWSRLADASLRDALSNYTAVQWRSATELEAPPNAVSPQLIVVNPGLHVIGSQIPVDVYDEDVSLLLHHMQDIINAQMRHAGEVVTRFIFQDITFLFDRRLPAWKRARLNETSVTRFNARLHKRLRAAIMQGERLRRITPWAPRWLSVLPAHRLTASADSPVDAGKNLVTGASDGVHYKGGYKNIVAQLYLFFMAQDAPSRFCWS